MRSRAIAVTVFCLIICVDSWAQRTTPPNRNLHRARAAVSGLMGGLLVAKYPRIPVDDRRSLDEVREGLIKQGNHLKGLIDAADKRPDSATAGSEAVVYLLVFFTAVDGWVNMLVSAAGAEAEDAGALNLMKLTTTLYNSSLDYSRDVAKLIYNTEVAANDCKGRK